MTTAAIGEERVLAGVIERAEDEWLSGVVDIKVHPSLYDFIARAVVAHLTSEAAVERVARASRKAATNVDQWDDLMPQMRQTWRSHARAAIRALLGEEPAP